MFTNLNSINKNIKIIRLNIVIGIQTLTLQLVCVFNGYCYLIYLKQ